MKQMKRILALVMVLVMMTPATLMAEEEISAALEIAAEIAAGEPAEASAEEVPAAGEAPAAEEEILLPDEAPAEEDEILPIEEAPAEEDAPAAETYSISAVEAALKKLGIDPLSVEPMVSRSGSHMLHATYKVAAFDSIKSYRYNDEATHHVIGDVYRYDYCMTCNEIIGSEFMYTDGSELDLHRFEPSEMGSYCSLCDYEIPLTGYTEVVEVYEPDEGMRTPVNDGDPETHLWKGKRIERTYYVDLYEGPSHRPDEDKILDADFEWREDHYFINGVCDDCGYARADACAHENVEVEPYFYDYAIFKNTGDPSEHRYVGEWYEFLYCADCGTELTAHPKTGESYPITHFAGDVARPHVFEGSKCIQCGYYQSLTVNAAELTLGVGEKFTLKTNQSSDQVWFGSLYVDIADVGKRTGEVVAKKAGKTEIYVRSLDGSEIVIPVTVAQKPSSIKLSETKLTMGVGETFQLETKLSAGSAGAIAWTSSSGSVAVKNGMLTAVKPGKATVTVKTYNGKSAKCTVTVKAAPTDKDMGVALSKSVIGVGETASVRGGMLNDCGGAFTLKITDGSAAALSADGKLTGTEVGSVTVTATAYNGAKASATLTVKPAPAKAEITNAPEALGIGEKYQLNVDLGGDCAGSVTFTSSSTKIAAVDADTGLITPKKAGTVKIAVSTYNGLSDVITITVGKKPTSIALSQTSLTLGVGESFQLLTKLSKGGASCIEWKSSSDCVTVAGGKVTAVKEGTAVVAARTFNGKIAQCAVTVKAAPTDADMSIQLSSGSIGVGQTALIRAGMANNCGGSVSYKVVEGSAATVDASGRITAVKAGKVTVAAVAYNGAKAVETLTVKPAPSKVEIINAPASLGVGETFKLNVQLGADGEDCAGSVTFASNKTKVAAVDADTGLVTAKKTGTVKIAATTHNGKSHVITLTVGKKPTSIILSQTSLTLGVGESFQLLTKLSKGGASCIEWKSSSDCVTVADGKVVAVKEGTAVVAARTYNGKIAQCAVTVKAAPTDADMSVQLSSGSIGVGQTAAIRAAMSDACAGSVSYKVVEGSAATVDASGRITAVEAGTVTVAAIAYNGAKAVETLTVKPAPSKIAITNAPASLGVGETYKLNVQLGADGEDCAGAVTFTSNKTKIAAVDKDTGVITPKKAGTVKIAAATHNGKSHVITITVGKAPTSIVLNKSSLTLGVGEDFQLLTKLSSKAASSIAWKVDGDCVTVKDGKVTAVKEGSAVITAATFNGKTAKCAVTVKAAPGSADMDAVLSSSLLGVGQTATIRTEMSDACAGEVHYRLVFRNGVITLDESGKITAKKAGTERIHIMAYNGASIFADVTVRPAPTKIAIQSPGTMYVGQKHNLEVRTDPRDALIPGSVVFTSGNKKIATVNASTGEITALKAGSVKITATTYNKKKASITIRIAAAPTTVKLSDELLYLGLGESYQLSANVPASTLTFTSSNPDVISVTPDGVITALQRTPSSDKTVRITATLPNGKSDSCTVWGSAAPTSITVGNVSGNRSELIIGRGLGIGVYYYGGRCESAPSVTLSDPSVLEIVECVNDNVSVRAKKVGECTVTIRTYNGLEESYTVVVVPGVEDIEFTLPDTLVAGYEYNLEQYLVLSPAETTSFSRNITEIKTNKSSVAVRNETQYPEFWLAARKPGTFTLTVTTENGKTFSKTFNVVDHKTIPEIPGKLEITYYIQAN